MPVITAAFVPQTSEQLLQSYLIWFVVFVLVNVVWDIFTPKTPPFHVSRLKDKLIVAVGSTSFCSGLLIFSSAFNSGTNAVVGSTPATLVIAAAAGILLSISYICPYEADVRMSNVRPD